MHTAVSGSSRTVMIVDDSKVSRMVIKAHILAVHADWNVIEAENGARAIELAGQAVPDYCTMDINMPGMPGTEAAAVLLQSHPQMRIAIFSANIQGAVQTRAQQMGAVFVAKPVTEKSVAQALSHFTRAA